jgi:uncharacterized DUF497 family protein
LIKANGCGKLFNKDTAMIYSFEWDETKDKRNIKDHKIRFAEAKTVLDDENSLTIDDPDHSTKNGILT